jgi:two-component system chemotaxis response regulator CheY
MMINSSVRVLVVDDVASMRAVLRLMLNCVGFETIETVENAKQALEKLQQNEFGLIISDVKMDEMTGLDLLNKIREAPTLQDIPTILVSAHSSELNSADAKRAGAQGYLLKPFRLENLKSAIKDAFAWRDALKLQKKANASKQPTVALAG